MESIHNLLIVGLPEAGKTSYIHAVDDLLQNPGDEQDALRSYGLADDRTYLEKDKEKYRAGKKLEHTARKLEGPKPELWFEHPKTSRRGHLFLPDVSGEVFQDQWTDRRWDKSFGDELKGVAGILLFIRADMPSSNQELLGPMAALPDDGQKPISFDPKKASPQVQLVDVLQFIASKGEMHRPVKLAVMISAWDTVLKPENKQPKDPPKFLEREWALLDQYLVCSPATFITRIYGVSALGGTEEELKKLAALPPQERVSIVDADHSSKDLTRPLRWLIDLE